MKMKITKAEAETIRRIRSGDNEHPNLYAALRARVAELEAEVASKDLDATEQAGRAEKAEAEVARLRARRFPVLGAGFSIPWACVAPFDAQAQANHDQSLDRLAARGGLDPLELWCVMHGKKWRERGSMTDAQALEWARGLAYWIAPISERERATKEALECAAKVLELCGVDPQIQRAALAPYAEVDCKAQWEDAEWTARRSREQRQRDEDRERWLEGRP